jgi:hypothetical protein
MGMLGKLWRIFAKPHMQRDMSVPMQVSSNLLEASLLYLLPGDPDAEQVAQHIQSLCAALPRRGGSLPAEQTGLLASKAFLYALSHVAQQHRSIAIRRHAMACLKYVAMQRGLTRHQLENQLVPSCGLDSSLVFDYGPRRFTLALGHQHTPLVRTEGERFHTSLPRPRPNDDPALIARAGELWATHKRRLAESSRTQAARLEQAMIDGLRWSPTEFTRDILGHPLMAQLGRRLIWAGYDANGALLEGFCLADDYSLVSETYQTIDLDRYAAIGLPHSASVAPERRLRWAELLGDFHIAPLFPQAGRTIYRLDQAERRAVAITRFQQIALRWGAFQGALSRRGWNFDLEHETASRLFEGARVMATIEIETQASAQHITRCWFEYIAADEDDPPVEEPRLSLCNVDQVVLSETLRDLSEIVANPKLLLE